MATILLLIACSSVTFNPYTVEGTQQSGVVGTNGCVISSLYSTILRDDVAVVIAQLQATSTTFVFRGYYKYGTTEGGLQAYPMLRAAINQIKGQMPDIH